MFAWGFFNADCCLFTDLGGTTKADRHWNNRLFISLRMQQSSVKWCLFLCSFLSIALQSLLWMKVFVCAALDFGRWTGTVGQVTAGGTIWWLLLNAVNYFSAHVYVDIWSFFFNWIFMETLNRVVASLRKEVHMSFLWRNNNNSYILQCRSNVSKTGLCYTVNKEKDLWS